MRCELVIIYRPEGGDAVTVAAIADRDLIHAAARKAIEESELAAEAMGDADPVLGEMQLLEAQRLRQVLATLIPELAAVPNAPATLTRATAGAPKESRPKCLCGKRGDMKGDQQIVSDRSRAVEYQKCHRARWWMYEYGHRGVAPVRLSLARASAFHAGAAELGRRVMQRQATGPVNVIDAACIDHAVAAAHAEFEQIVSSRGLDLAQLNAADELHRDLAYNYQEERQLLAGMVQVYAKRGLPELIKRSRLAQVEQEHVAPMGKPAGIWSEAVSPGREFGVAA